RIARATKMSAFGLFVALACAGAWQFRHQPVSPHEPLTLRPISVEDAAAGEGSTPPERPTLRVGTFNIHGGQGRDGRRDLDRTARSLQELDVVGLNEVRGDWFAWRPDQADELGRRLNMSSLFAPSEQVGWFDRFGNGLLSRLQLTGVQRIPLPGTQSKRFRNAVLTGVHWDGQIVRVLAVHVDSTRDRERQLAVISDLFLSLDEPALLMGDLNSRRDDPTLQRLLVTPGVIDVAAAAEPIDCPPERRIDWILTRGLKAIRAEVRDDGASDHPIVRAELVRGEPVRRDPIPRVSDRNLR
ncbi:MAG TPA: endonuclease/exonuclease/phosphatase family protein, partial [Planctomycetaceae bacterium]|nr:endonuclease/exonuclease/phosphatase family protein [Planctomycetaceae bacterium]